MPVLASAGLTSDTSEKRAVHTAMREGSFLLSSLFAYFFDNEKSKNKKRRIVLLIN